MLLVSKPQHFKVRKREILEDMDVYDCLRLLSEGHKMYCELCDSATNNWLKCKDTTMVYDLENTDNESLKLIRKFYIAYSALIIYECIRFGKQLRYLQLRFMYSFETITNKFLQTGEYNLYKDIFELENKKLILCATYMHKKSDYFNSAKNRIATLKLACEYHKHSLLKQFDSRHFK